MDLGWLVFSHLISIICGIADSDPCCAELNFHCDTPYIIFILPFHFYPHEHSTHKHSSHHYHSCDFCIRLTYRSLWSFQR